jgi:hypothetical protein
MARYEKQKIIYNFLNCLPDYHRLSWHHTIENTYDDLMKEQSIAGYCIVSRGITKDRVYHFIKL